MGGFALRQALQRTGQVLGARAASTATGAAVALKDRDGLLGSLPTQDQIMKPYYERLARMRVIPSPTILELSPSERQAELELLRMHNSSLPVSVLEGHMIKAQVLEIGRRSVTLDTGLLPARVPRSDLTPDCLIGATFELDKPRGPGEIRVGDVVQVYLESLGTVDKNLPVSGMQGATARRIAAVWQELEERHKRGEMVKGRILNAVHRGFAVGVAGVVGFLPARQCSRPTARRIGQLQKFRILELDCSRRNLILADPNLHHSTAAGAETQPNLSFARKRPSRNAEEAARRQELARVADELRSVLALRSSRSSSSIADKDVRSTTSKEDSSTSPSNDGSTPAASPVAQPSTT